MSRAPGCGSRAVNRGQPTMERRKFIIGAGALATGSAAAVGTGAFSTAQVDRDANVEIVNDSDSLVSLDSDLDSDIVTTESIRGGLGDDAPELLSIDFDVDGGGDGINPNSTYLLGTPPEISNWPGDTRTTNALSGFFEDGEFEEDHAFRVTNNDTVTHDISIEVESAEGNSFGNGQVWFGIVTEKDGSLENDDTWDGGDVSLADIGSGDTVYTFLAVRARGTFETFTDLSLDITVTAD